MNHYICIHGHFYQPPRENPWLETVEKEDSAAPYHDWNERITEECYLPNANSRIMNEEKRIVKIVNNYSKISFNFGPTLLSWIEEKNKELYLAIIQADKDSQLQFEGHGNAIAQVYNHIILPLANSNDKLTQIIWGIKDFEHRFNRTPEGMWLPETAVNVDSLVLMAEQGIKFTILAQHQASQIRKIGSSEWQKIQTTLIDPTMPYLLNLPNNRSIAIFFYDGKVSQSVAFSSTLDKGENLVESINKIFSDQENKVQLAHIATDGETYGHHHVHGDMALAYALDYIEKNNFAKLINYGQFLAKYPPTHEVEIIDNSSWSCIHGIERWKNACGCNSGEHNNWQQNWRAPLRETFDWLRDKLWVLYAQKGMELFKDPVKARNDYIDVILSRSPDCLSVFFENNVSHPLNEEETVNALILLEIQRNSMLMYTSCGWFFDELSGITTVQVIKYAARAIQLAQKYFSESLENGLLERLENCKSNLKQFQDGKFIYLHFVKPLIINWDDIVAHYAISALFGNYKKTINIFCYIVETLNYNKYSNGKASFNMGHSIFTSKITTEKVSYMFSVINFGDQNISCGVKKFTSSEEYNTILKNLISAFNASDMVSVSNLINKYFENSHFSFSSLFYDKKRKISYFILNDALNELKSLFNQLYKNNSSLIGFISSLNIPLPDAYKTITEYYIKFQLEKEFRGNILHQKKINNLINIAKSSQIKLDKGLLKFILQKHLEKLMNKFKKNPNDYDKLKIINDKLEILQNISFPIKLFHLQNLYYKILHDSYPNFKKIADEGDIGKKEWIEKFTHLGNLLLMEISTNA